MNTNEGPFRQHSAAPPTTASGGDQVVVNLAPPSGGPSDPLRAVPGWRVDAALADLHTYLREAGLTAGTTAVSVGGLGFRKTTTLPAPRGDA